MRLKTTPPAPPTASTAVQDAIARAAEAAARGHTRKADRESRLAARLERLTRNTSPAVEEVEPSPEFFQRDLERRINRHLAEQRRERDALKARDPEAWAAAYNEARAEALASVDAQWVGDAEMFEEA